MSFPQTRMRRLRRTPALREFVRENRLRIGQLVYPLFVSETAQEPEQIEGMPEVLRLPLAAAVKEAGEVASLGVGAVMLFGVPERKDEQATSAFAEDGIVQQAVQAIKSEHPELAVFTDVCLCQYTDHGHCGLLNQTGEIDNDASLEVLAQTAVSHAEAGADLVAPSDMMDGRVGALRSALDRAGFSYTPIMSYSAKFASAFYGPFRAAANSVPAFGDRRSYQMDSANGEEALRATLEDIDQGADIVLVKPALPYLDVVARIADSVRIPIAAYNVSGEYAMVKAAAQAGWLDERACVLESLTAMVRAGAQIVITYHAKDVAKWLN